MRYRIVLSRGLTINAIRLRQYLRHPWGLKYIYMRMALCKVRSQSYATCMRR